MVCIFAFSAAAYATGSGSQTAVPESAAMVLAPTGLAAALALNRFRSRYDYVREGISFGYYTAKRVFDVIVAIVVLAITSPIFILTALLVRLDSAGPIIFRRMAMGKYGKVFPMYKFRTMVDGAERILEQSEELKKAYYSNCKLKDDPRVTRLGKFLRKTSLDELPQLLDVLLGHMTFVGPRPIAADEVALYGPSVERFKSVTPGITGLWQTCGRSETSYDRRVELDMQYIDKRSLLLDLRILLNTIPSVLLKRGAF
jgi:lipopolysaccharide/colanic/teichoic acid biosynthesis glycosyltransferase